MRSKKFWKTTSRAVVATGSLFVVAWLWLLIEIARSPLQPRLPSNLIPFNNHGHDVYITQFQNELLASFCGGPLGLVFLLLVVLAWITAWIADRLPS